MIQVLVHLTHLSNIAQNSPKHSSTVFHTSQPSILGSRQQLYPGLIIETSCTNYTKIYKISVFFISWILKVKHMTYYCLTLWTCCRNYVDWHRFLWCQWSYFVVHKAPTLILNKIGRKISMLWMQCSD